MSLTCWQDIAPKDAVDIDLSVRLDISAPVNEKGERCAWPWEPQLMSESIGRYSCSYCWATVTAGAPHPDYGPSAPAPTSRRRGTGGTPPPPATRSGTSGRS
jgi:hypothetical protein